MIRRRSRFSERVSGPGPILRASARRARPRGYIWLVAVVGCALCAPVSPASAQDFVRASGRRLFLPSTGQSVCLRGVGFATDLLHDPSDPSGPWLRNSAGDHWLPVTTWYSQDDVQSVAGIGFNAMRVSLNYRLFEDDGAPCTCDLQSGACASIFARPAGDPCNYVNSVWSQDPAFASGWDYLDAWIQWATAHGVYIILDMHTPPGGLQLSPEGVRLWTDSQNAARLKRLWRAIAKRYAAEPRIAAYDILNEPAPAAPNPDLATAGLWQSLATEIVAEIRKEDPNHLIILERVIAITDDAFNFVFDDFTQPMANSWFLLADPNVMYDFHFYWPMINHQSNWAMCGGTPSYPAPALLEETFLGQPRASCDQASVEAHLAAFNAFGIANDVPTSVTEWGGAVSGGDIFGNAGGLAYIADMLGILERAGASWTFFYANTLHQSSDQVQPFDPARTAVFSTYFQNAACAGSAPPAPSCASAPRSGCDVAARADLSLRDDPSDDRRDRLRLRLSRGLVRRSRSVFGDPLTDEAYRLCVYDHGALIDEAGVPAGTSAWRQGGASGYRYRDGHAASDGTKRLVLKAGSPLVPKPVRITWVGLGSGLPDPGLPLQAPVDVTAQVVGSSGACFTAAFTSASRNDGPSSARPGLFLARRR